MEKIHPVILCGGHGRRLWPRSRANRPKPFLRLLGARTLFQMALDRVSDPALFTDPIVVAGEAHVDLVAQQAGPHRLIVEPEAKSTAPAIALAAQVLPADALVLVCPSDHHIGDTEAFRAAVKDGSELARNGHIVVFGIAPTRAETGYGYIERGDAMGSGYRVERFLEKPDAQAAARFVADPRFTWNSGMFLFRVDVLRAELGRLMPAMAAGIKAAMATAMRSGDVLRPAAQAFSAVESVSFDHAIMERTDRAAVVPVDMGWSDIGTWTALAEARADWDRRDWNNARGDVIGGDRVMIDSDGPRVSVVGLSDVIVVVEGAEVLVVHRDAAQHVGKLPGAQEG